MPLDLLVLGGGFTGLAAAHRARARGLRVEVWEAMDRVGGWVQTRDWPDAQGRTGRFDLGPQGLRFTPGSALDHLVKDLDLPLVKEAPRGPRWMLEAQGRRPLGRGLGLLGALSWPARLRLLLEPFQGPLTPGPASLSDLAHHRFGSGFARHLWPALIQGLAGAPPEALDLDLLSAVAALDAWGGVLRQALSRPAPRRRRPEGGMGRLTASLAAQVEVRTGCQAVSLTRQDEAWEAHTRDGRLVSARRIFLALPAFAAAPLLAAHAPLAAEALSTLPHTDLWVRHSRHTPVAGWEAGVTLLVHPEASHTLLGATSLPLDQAPWLQLRTLGTGPCEAPLPELGPPRDWVETPLARALPRPHPGEMARLRQACAALPPGLEAGGAWRWGPGLADLAQGIAGL